MAGDWFKLGYWRSRSPEVLEIADQTGRSRHEVLGLLCDLWSWASSESVDGTIRGVRLQHLPGAVCADEHFWRAVADAGWIAEDEFGLVIPGWEIWLSDSAKRRAKDATRQARHRKKRHASVTPVSQKCHKKNVTREEKRREEKKNTEEPPVDPPRKVAAKPTADRPAKVAEPPPIPPELDSPEFRAAWSAWEASRSAIKKPLNDGMRSTQLRKLARLGVSSAIECLEYSTANGYQGLIFDRFAEPVRAKSNAMKTKGQQQDEYVMQLFMGIDSPGGNDDEQLAIEE